MRYLCKKHEGVFRARPRSCVRVVDSLVVLEPDHLLIILMVLRIVWMVNMLSSDNERDLGKGIATVSLADHLHCGSHPEL